MNDLQEKAGGGILLLCIAGMTPMIITETLWYLTQRIGELVEEIRVVTTLKGRDEVVKHLLANGSGKFYEFCQDYEIDWPIKFDETCITVLRAEDMKSLPDIITPEDNHLAANQIYDIVRLLTRDPHRRIHASAAGGRKTMGFYLSAAMQLFGRASDRVSHTLVHPDFEFNREFFYPPVAPRELEIKRDGRTVKVSTANAWVELVEIPFVRVRGIAGDALDKEGSYATLVKTTQEDVDFLDSAYDLKFSFEKKRRGIEVYSRFVKIQPMREFLIYILFALARRDDENGGGLLAVEELTEHHFNKAFRAIMKGFGKERSLADVVCWEDEDKFEFLESYLKDINRKNYHYLKEAFAQTIARINRKIKAERLPQRYAITSVEIDGHARYGLQLAPERIIL